MKVENLTESGKIERQILFRMITSTEVLARIFPIWKKKMFESQPANLIGYWCVKHYERYQSAPNESIIGIFRKWAVKNEKNPNLEMIEHLLERLREGFGEIADINVDVEVDFAADHFNHIRIKNLIEELSQKVEAGEHEEAWEFLQSSNKVDMGQGRFVDVLRDREALRIAFEDTESSLIAFNTQETLCLNQFFSNDLQRECFVSILAPEKGGKSTHLRQFAFWGFLNKRKVAYFEVGDNTEKQVLRRMYVKAAKKPLRSRGNQWPCQVKFPIDVKIPKEVDPDENFCPIIKHKTLKFSKPLTEDEAWDSFEKYTTNLGSEESYFRLSCHPNSSINVHQIRIILSSWEKQGFVPDIVIIDYADILSPEPGSSKQDKRDQINSNWKSLRALSQEKHCLVITATQANARSYNKETLNRENFSEDKRKLGHVTAMMGLNVNPTEKVNGACRWNWIVRREEEFSSSKCLYVAQCLALDDPCVLTTW